MDAMDGWMGWMNRNRVTLGWIKREYSRDSRMNMDSRTPQGMFSDWY